MASSLFITATDTEAGKSFITAALTRALCAAGRDVVALKPVACGRDGDAMNGDVATLLAAQGMSKTQAYEINLYDFAAFAAPVFAAHAEGRDIDAAALTDWCRKQAGSHDLTLIEGVGGLMVPLAGGLLVCDWLQMLPEARVLLVVRARLGGINQALLTLDKLQRMGRSPEWVVVNALDVQGNTMLADHCSAIAPYLDAVSSLLQMPFTPDARLAEQKVIRWQGIRDL